MVCNNIKENNMKLREFKTVSFPINVPVGNYCYKKNQTRCMHCVDKGKGKVICAIGFNMSSYKDNTVYKPAECRELYDCL